MIGVILRLLHRVVVVVAVVADVAIVRYHQRFVVAIEVRWSQQPTNGGILLFASLVVLLLVLRRMGREWWGYVLRECRDLGTDRTKDSKVKSSQQMILSLILSRHHLVPAPLCKWYWAFQLLQNNNTCTVLNYFVSTSTIDDKVVSLLVGTKRTVIGGSAAHSRIQ